MSKNKAIPVVIIILGVMLMLIGIYQGEVSYIFHKAITVCFECIGIG